MQGAMFVCSFFFSHETTNNHFLGLQGMPFGFFNKYLNETAYWHSLVPNRMI
jgi:hypothetical protein